MQGYKFNTEAEAIQAQLECDTYHKIEIKEGYIAKHWTGYIYSELDGFWYITAHESLVPVLGTPIDITITNHEEI